MFCGAEFVLKFTSFRSMELTHLSCVSFQCAQRPSIEDLLVNPMVSKHLPSTHTKQCDSANSAATTSSSIDDLIKKAADLSAREKRCSDRELKCSQLETQLRVREARLHERERLLQAKERELEKTRKDLTGKRYLAVIGPAIGQVA